MIDLVVTTAREAGQIIESHRRTALHVQQKDAGEGPVTDADRAADAFLHEHLTEIRDIAWLSEETADDAVRLTREAVWIVDPLDGTIEFIAGRPEYAISIALVEKGQPTLGVIHRPATGDTVWGRRGGGCLLNGEPVFVRESLDLVASRTELAHGEFEAFAGSWRLHPHGSIAWKLAMVAAGQAGATLSRGPKWEWDICAGALLVSEAGGQVSDILGNPIRFNRSTPKIAGIVAAAPQAYRRLRPTLDTLGLVDRTKQTTPDPPSA